MEIRKTEFDEPEIIKLVILGAGGYGKAVLDLGNQLGYSYIVLDDKSSKPLSMYTSYISDSTYFIPAFGNNEFRMKWINQLVSSGCRLAILIHPRAYVSPTVTIGSGCVILPNACIGTDVVLGSGCIINLGAIVDHGCILEDGVYIAPGGIVKGDNRISSCTKVDSGEVIEARKYSVGGKNE